ncbi:MAG: tRNA 2-selenouridine(34) synthase MnmH [Desulfobacteraceae bacterium]|nr:tRNA 2-selenouridine(34) synthase MnmH [Desulfobacteraceae bacterium]
MTFCSIKPVEFIKKSENELIIDVRSPLEYQKGHIPGAVNIPVFDNEERKDIGTIYKEQGKKEAVLKGLLYVQPKLLSFVSRIYSLISDESQEIFVYCQRGGMRSESFSWLLHTSGLKVSRLDSGYKNFRQLVLDTLEKKMEFILLGGKTGCGKTDILHELEKKGEQVLDLEKIACHKGSAFGDLGQDEQPSPQQFENNLFKKLFQFDQNKPVWVENESPGIGGLFIPLGVRNNMKNALLINIELPLNERIKRIAKEYGKFEALLLEERLKKIKKKLGPENLEKACFHLLNNEIEKTITILLNYYDKGYSHYMKKIDFHENNKTINLEKDNPKQNAQIILNSYSCRTSIIGSSH